MKNVYNCLDNLWEDFKKRQNLNDIALKQFKEYYNLLIEYNKIHNITAITNFNEVINDHFNDSLSLSNFENIAAINCLADVGSGAGFPAIPLKIKFPHLNVILIEVNNKKVEFLTQICQKLELINVEITDSDFRTFLRKTDYKIDIFCARASLQPEELIRIFMPSCVYNKSKLVYWASKSWQPDNKIKNLIVNEVNYVTGNKERKLIFFENKIERN